MELWNEFRSLVAFSRTDKPGELDWGRLPVLALLSGTGKPAALEFCNGAGGRLPVLARLLGNIGEGPASRRLLESIGLRALLVEAFMALSDSILGGMLLGGGGGCEGGRGACFLATLLDRRDSKRASNSLSVAVVLERSRFTGLGREEGFKTAGSSSLFFRFFADGDDAMGGPALILSGLSSEEEVVDSCETGVSASRTDSTGLGSSLLFLFSGGEDVTISTSSANLTVESVRLRVEGSGYKS